MTNSSNITGIFSRLIELIKKRLNSTTAWETMSKATFNMTDLSSACQMPMQNPRLDNSDLRELLAQATKKATTPDTESAIRHTLIPAVAIVQKQNTVQATLDQVPVIHAVAATTIN